MDQNTTNRVALVYAYTISALAIGGVFGMFVLALVRDGVYSDLLKTYWPQIIMLAVGALGLTGIVHGAVSAYVTKGVAQAQAATDIAQTKANAETSIAQTNAGNGTPPPPTISAPPVQ